jgi:hypothetical protein
VITGSRTEAAWLVSAGLTLRGPDRRWSLSLDCTNCLSESFFQNALAQLFLPEPAADVDAARRTEF